MKLSVLIPSLVSRRDFLDRLIEQMGKQLPYPGIGEYVEMKTFIDNGSHSIGFKRNQLLKEATGEYIAFIDDDDRISDKYFKLVLEGIEKGVDCCSLKGIITEDGMNPLVFEHSIKYNEYKTNPDHMPVSYERYPNHLNCIKANIAKQFKFPETNHGEDTDWATQIHNSGLLKTEHYIEEVLYYYDYRSKK